MALQQQVFTLFTDLQFSKAKVGWLLFTVLSNSGVARLPGSFVHMAADRATAADHGSQLLL